MSTQCWLRITNSDNIQICGLLARLSPKIRFNRVGKLGPKMGPSVRSPKVADGGFGHRMPSVQGLRSVRRGHDGVSSALRAFPRKFSPERIHFIMSSR